MASESAVVYDLDGTLVRLAVDWDAVRADAAAVFTDAGGAAAAAAEGTDLWDLQGVAPDFGLAAELEAAIAAHEREGAAASDRLPAADVLVAEPGPAAVCSLNCEAACRLALDRHDLTEHVGPIVGRDTVAGQKPDPEPLREAVDRLGVDPEDALFVGDSERDAVAAERAGVPFEYVESFLASR